MRRVLVSIVVNTAVVTQLLDRSAATPTGWTHPDSKKTINSIVKRSWKSTRPLITAGLPLHAKLSNILSAQVNPEDTACQRNLLAIRRTDLMGCFWGALLGPINTVDRRESTANRGHSSKAFVAVCGTNMRVQFSMVRKPDDQLAGWH